MGDPYHPIYEALWNDPKFSEWPQPWLHRAFFGYLCSHQRVRPAGIYAVTPEVLAAETGQPQDWTAEALGRFTTERMIQMERGLLWVVKYLARQPNRMTPSYKISVVNRLNELGLSHPLVILFFDTYPYLATTCRHLGLTQGPAKRRPAGSQATPKAPTSAASPSPSPSPSPIQTPTTTGGDPGGNGLQTWPQEWAPLRAKIEALPFLRKHVAWLDDLDWWRTLDEWLTSVPKGLDELLVDAVAYITSEGFVPRTKRSLRAKIKNCLHTAGRIAEREAQRQRT